MVNQKVNMAALTNRIVDEDQIKADEVHPSLSSFSSLRVGLKPLFSYLNLTMLNSVQTPGRLGWNPQYPCYNTVKRTISVTSNLDSINLTQPTRKSNIVELNVEQ
jgi:hypothetical protein